MTEAAPDRGRLYPFKLAVAVLVLASVFAPGVVVVTGGRPYDVANERAGAGTNLGAGRCGAATMYQ